MDSATDFNYIAFVDDLQPLARSDSPTQQRRAGWLILKECPEGIQPEVARLLGYARGMVANEDNPGGDNVRGWRKITPRNTIVNGANVTIFRDTSLTHFVLGGRWNANGNYETPGGGLKPNETLLQCGQREGEKETGLKIKMIGWCGTFDDPSEEYWIRYPDGENRRSIAQVYAAVVIGGELKVGLESTSFEWHHVAAKLERDMLPQHRRLAEIGLLPPDQWLRAF